MVCWAEILCNILPDEHIVRETPILAESKRWLDVYFSGEEPNFTPPLHLIGSCIQTGSVADFAADPVWSDNDIRRDCRTTGRKAWHGSYVCTGSWRCSRHNEVSIIIPCHRVVGANGSLTGYAGGIDKRYDCWN